MAARLKELYRNEIVPALKEELGRTNVMAVPKIEKICLNMGLGRAMEDSKKLEAAQKHMTTIAGQAACVTKARISVSNFKVREGWNIGCRVTLRGERMYEFLDRLVNIAVPAIRDFRGIKATSFDGQGNFSMGVEEITIFPEVDPDKVDEQLGLDVTVVIKNSNGAEESRRLLQLMGMPFRQN